MNLKSKSLLVGALGGLLFGGSLTAATASQNPSPSFEQNADGETYGSIAEVSSPALAPDLILVYADNGSLGYVRHADYYPSTSPTSAENVGVPAGTSKARTISVYAEDGETVVGEFTLDAVAAGSRG